ncbi:MAG TPA: tetratricopeptide repeat protein [Acetobacteraceae bacterium]|nr:tetratricopeptide repeat protein [Acetobacteraceae bacterium]
MIRGRTLWLVAVLLIAGGSFAPVQAQPRTDRQAAITRMLDALKTAPDEQTAAALEHQAQKMWLEAGTPAVTLLMGRGMRALESGDNEEALASFSDAITLDPNLAEAWHQRAVAKYHSGDTPGAIRDIEQTLKLEPRDFPALRTLTEIAVGREDWKSAYAAWQKVLEIDPKTPAGEERLKDLKRRAFGEET